MGKYRITFRKSVAKDLRAIPNSDVAKILKAIDELSETPRGRDCVKLSGQEKYRIRQGDYRILYEIHDEEIVVVVVKVCHRRDAYRNI